LRMLKNLGTLQGVLICVILESERLNLTGNLQVKKRGIAELFIDGTFVILKVRHRSEI